MTRTPKTVLIGFYPAHLPRFDTILLNLKR